MPGNQAVSELRTHDLTSVQEPAEMLDQALDLAAQSFKNLRAYATELYSAAASVAVDFADAIDGIANRF
jgi:hypothetical protein